MNILVIVGTVFLVRLYGVEGDYWSTLGVHVRVGVCMRVCVRVRAHSQIFEIKIPTFILLGMQMHEVITFHHTKKLRSHHLYFMVE